MYLFAQPPVCRCCAVVFSDAAPSLSRKCGTTDSDGESTNASSSSSSSRCVALLQVLLPTEVSLPSLPRQNRNHQMHTMRRFGSCIYCWAFVEIPSDPLSLSARSILLWPILHARARDERSAEENRTDGAASGTDSPSSLIEEGCWLVGKKEESLLPWLQRGEANQCANGLKNSRLSTVSNYCACTKQP